jgi:Protein of unknown function (DUF992)
MRLLSKEGLPHTLPSGRPTSQGVNAMFSNQSRRYVLVVGLLFAATVAAPAEAQAPGAWTQAGVLKCRLNPSIGFIIVGHQSMECKFESGEGYPAQAYEGAINSVGLDLGVTAGGVLAWAVLAPTKGVPTGALAGEYVGASGDIGIGVGAGANILVGGSGRTFALQPLSVEGSVGLNIALGVSMLKLRAV